MRLEQAHLVNDKDNIFLEEYYEYMVDTAVLFGADPHSAMNEMKESLEFEIELAKIKERLGEIPLQDYQSMNILDLQQIFPNTPWQEFFNQLFVHQDYIIACQLKYLEHLEILLSKTPKRFLVTFLHIICKYCSQL